MHTAQRQNNAAKRGAPTELLREEFASCMVQRQNNATPRGAQAKPKREEIALRMVQR